ncbi:hypothetical protein FNS94_06465 [Salmonella enterica]|nr:hypothetical protein [Salmonella enterica]
MNTEITIKHVQLARSGYYARGLTSACTLLSIPNNKISERAVVKYQGASIGRIDNLYYSDLRDGRVELHGNITFTGSFTMLAEMLKDEALYPVCVINTTSGQNQSWLSEVFFAPAEDREFDEQEPINLKGLLNLVNLMAKSEVPAKPQGDTPYIYAPGMNRDDITNWLNRIVSDLNTVDVRKGSIKSLEESCKELKGELGEIEQFLNKTIRV